MLHFCSNGIKLKIFATTFDAIKIITIKMLQNNIYSGFVNWYEFR